jgi:tetratricopeptide (TPR) repeat protein/transcriptional regulator with XRE-family HTH domain
MRERVVVSTADDNLAALLRSHRIVAGLSQEELSDSSGLSARAISNIERGKTPHPYARTIRLLADALGLQGRVREELLRAAHPAVDGPAGTGDGGARAAGQEAEPAARDDRLSRVWTAATRTLPRDIAGFTGRRDELARLDAAALLTGRVMRIQAIGGMAGVGKTALAVNAAHRLAPLFPDGQLFVPLHGHTPGRFPIDPADALASLLLTAGITASQLPAGLEERAGLWRHHLAGRRALLVLDDAVSSEQIEPLLPGTGASLVLVTSRRHLSALEDAEVLSLDVLSPDDAAELLVRLAARPGLDPDDEATSEICASCGYLPLAIGMLARQLHHHPAWTATRLAADLAAARDRLGLMAAENVSVSAAFDLSYADLTAGQQRLFRRLGLHPGSNIDAYATAALADCSLTAARTGLERLYDHYLLTETVDSRYVLHDLVREHARVLADRQDPVSDRELALGRLLDYYAHTAAIAGSRFASQTHSRSGPPVVAPPGAVPDLPDSAQALAWIRAERASMLACLGRATETGQHARVVALTAGLAALLRTDGPWTEAAAFHRTAVAAARRCGDRSGQADALSNLGSVLELTGDYSGAARASEEALRIYRDLGYRLGQANALLSLGTTRCLTDDHRGAAQARELALDIYSDLGDRLGQATALHDAGIGNYMTGDYQGAARALTAALDISRDLGDRLTQAHALDNLGIVRRATGDYWPAAQANTEALDIYRSLGYRLGQANALDNLGVVYRLTGDCPGATQANTEALEIYIDLGNRLGQARALLNLGVAHRLTGGYAEAARTLEAALDISRDLGDWQGEAEALNEIGTLRRASGDLDAADAYHRQALELARARKGNWDEGHALAGLGRCSLAAGRDTEARTWLRQAHEIFQQIGAAEATEISAELDALAAG